MIDASSPVKKVPARFASPADRIARDRPPSSAAPARGVSSGLMLKATTSKSLPASSETGFRLRVSPFKKLVAEQRAAIINRRQDHGPAPEADRPARSSRPDSSRKRAPSGSCAPSFWSKPDLAVTGLPVACQRPARRHRPTNTRPIEQGRKYVSSSRHGFCSSVDAWLRCRLLRL